MKNSIFEQFEKSGTFFIPDSFYGKIGEVDRRQVKQYLIQKFGYKCAICGISTWNNKPLTLIVDHIDGNHSNHSTSNYRLICPNCDSQLPTFKSKNKNQLHNRPCHHYSTNNWTGKGLRYFHKEGEGRKRFDISLQEELEKQGWILGYK